LAKAANTESWWRSRSNRGRSTSADYLFSPDFRRAAERGATTLSELRQAGYVEGRETLVITDAGLTALGDFQPLPTGEDLINYWRGRLGEGGKRKIFDVIVEAYPNAIDQESIASAANLSSKSGTWSNYLSELRGLGLIDGRAELTASKELF
jgi:hypothetical protein